MKGIMRRGDSLREKYIINPPIKGKLHKADQCDIFF